MWKELSEEEKIKWTAVNDEMELKAIDRGVDRFRRALENMELSPAGRSVISKKIQAVSDAIHGDQQRMLGGMASAGRPASWGPAYLTMSPDKLALMTLASLIKIDTMDSGKLTALASTLADRIKLEHQLEEIQRINRIRSKEDRGFSRNMIDKIRGDESKIKKLFNKMNGKPIKWNLTQKLGIGTRLIMLVCRMDIGFELKLIRDKKRTVYFVERVGELKERMSALTAFSELLSPCFTPMTCPPVPWVQTGKDIKGGYRFNLVEPIKYQGISGQHRPDLSKHDISYVLNAVNAIQNVQWKIDTETLDMAIRVFHADNSKYDGLIPAVPTEKPPPIDKNATKEEVKVWRQKKEAIRAASQVSFSKRIRAYMAINEAKNLIGQPVYFVHCLDWRGRIYPASTAVNPQGTDLCKALIQYAEGRPLGSGGLRELKIWAAGCAGQDKISFDDRVKWWDTTWGDKPDVENDLRWIEYDDPFLFAQAARDIARAHKSGNPETYVSHVSVCKDGSQNGLQHLSAMGRDEVGGEAVNLVDADVPQDLYANVAALVHNAVDADADKAIESGEVLDDCNQDVPPIAWLETMQNPKKRRKVVKRSVLAYPYGVTKPGMRDGLLADGFTDSLQGSKYKNAWYLAEKIDLAVRDVVISAARLMDWMRACAEALGREGKPVEWVTPSGFPCRMRYLDQEDKRIEVNGIKLTIKSDLPEVDVAAQMRGVVANVVHSLDASHLVLTCHGVMEDGLTSFQFIHDSYGTHAGAIHVVEKRLREQFVEMHTENLVMGLHDWLMESGVEVPEPPPMGSLDINSVLNSKYFFA
jgi:DNA-directed RNA polymerase